MAFDRDLRDLLKAVQASSSPAEGNRRAHRRPDATRQHEGSLAMARRHVSEAEERIKRQREIVADLRSKDQDSELAEALLSLFEDFLAAHQLHLRRLQRGENQAPPFGPT